MLLYVPELRKHGRGDGKAGPLAPSPDAERRVWQTTRSSGPCPGARTHCRAAGCSTSPRLDSVVASVCLLLARSRSSRRAAWPRVPRRSARCRTATEPLCRYGAVVPSLGPTNRWYGARSSRSHSEGACSIRAPTRVRGCRGDGPPRPAPPSVQRSEPRFHRPHAPRDMKPRPTASHPQAAA